MWPDKDCDILEAGNSLSKFELPWLGLALSLPKSSNCLVHRTCILMMIVVTGSTAWSRGRDMQSRGVKQEEPVWMSSQPVTPGHALQALRELCCFQKVVIPLTMCSACSSRRQAEMVCVGSARGTVTALAGSQVQGSLVHHQTQPYDLTSLARDEL